MTPHLVIERAPAPEDLATRARRIVGRLFLLVLGALVIVGLLLLFDPTAPTEAPQGAHSVTGALDGLWGATEAPAWVTDGLAPYGCDGAEAYMVQLTPADRALIEGMIDGEIRLPWRVVGCEGVQDE